MSKNNLWSLIFGNTESGGKRIFEIGGKDKNDKPWYVRIGEDTKSGTKKLNK
ncbi:hypothetical protein [Gelidibacter japonicus]|uniref:hypothetical protein n=1 Tax=Gelidibacter japonicus TaxID=1962232 RepID=UPI003A90E9FF